MGAIAKNLAPQLVQSAGEPDRRVSAFCLDDSLERIRPLDLKEIQQLSKFLPLLVLIPKSNLKDQAIPSKISAKSFRQDSDKSQLIRHFGEATQQYKRPSADEFVFGDAAVNFLAMEAWRKGEPVTLTAMEFKLLRYMIRNEGRVISRDELLNEVWGYENYPCTRTVDNHILRLRQKFEREPSRPVHFRTVHGAGYKFLPDQA